MDLRAENMNKENSNIYVDIFYTKHYEKFIYTYNIYIHICVLLFINRSQVYTLQFPSFGFAVLVFTRIPRVPVPNFGFAVSLLALSWFAVSAFCFLCYIDPYIHVHTSAYV